jgi:hypothetical protein
VGKVNLNDDDRNDYAAVVSYLVGGGVKPERAALYADSYLEYRIAQDNIRRLGSVVADARTGAAAQNPYLAVRDKAFARLESMHKTRGLDVSGLW